MQTGLTSFSDEKRLAHHGDKAGNYRGRIDYTPAPKTNECSAEIVIIPGCNPTPNRNENIYIPLT
jgi:hypothetical protein